ncbi:hypothetical protein Tco_1322579 [Tanacetum coccineum]
MIMEDSKDGIKDLSNEEVYEAVKLIDDPLLHVEPSPKASKKPKISKKRRIIRSQAKPSPKASKQPEPSCEPSESSLGSIDFKAFKNNVLVTEKVNQARIDERITLLKSLNKVSETLEVDSALKATMQTMAETITITS